MESIKAFTSKSPWPSYRNRVPILSVHCYSPPGHKSPPHAVKILQNNGVVLDFLPRGDDFGTMKDPSPVGYKELTVACG